MVKEATIYITKTDRERLGALIERVRDQNDRGNLRYINTLDEELEFAEIVEPENIPHDVITMRSKVRLKDIESDRESVYSLVFPTEANSDEGMISILAPLATAILGRRRGDIIEFQAPSRLRKLKVEEILYQPESVHEYDL
ncbi:MAG TPA: nucleoside diphosphate kinase regulator [Pyrinomonadaceae bacterium]|nr:nucleoside diphosphate kinase regulator [Pyrinomonadaceae bacterium]